MAERILRPQPRIIPNTKPSDTPAQDPTTSQEQEGLASIAFLAGITPTNTAVARYVNTLNNAAYAASLQGAAQ